MRVGAVLLVAFMMGMSHARASCLEEFRDHMNGIFHHGPYQIDGQLRSDRSEGRSEVKFIYPSRVSIKVYNAQGDLTFGAIDIENRAWRLDHNGYWVVFNGEDPYSLKNEIARGSGNFQMATHVACPDPMPNFVDEYTDYQYQNPFLKGNGSYLVFIKFNTSDGLPMRAAFSWSSLMHSGEEIYKYRFDPYIHVDPPISDHAP